MVGIRVSRANQEWHAILAPYNTANERYLQLDKAASDEERTRALEGLRVASSNLFNGLAPDLDALATKVMAYRMHCIDVSPAVVHELDELVGNIRWIERNLRAIYCDKNGKFTG